MENNLTEGVTPMSDGDKQKEGAVGEPQGQAGATAGSAMQPEVQAADALQQELEKQKELAKRHLDGWKRAAADLENYRKRVEKEHAELVRFGHAALIMQLLSVLDDLERAFQTLPAGLSSFTWIEGLALIDRKLRVALESQGLKEIEAFGKPFDPLAHEAVLQQESTAYPDGQVIATLQKGYRLHERVLRPAMVQVARNAEHSTTAAAGTGQPGSDEPKEDETESK
jgi:molecular chaperone GrpE